MPATRALSSVLFLLLAVASQGAAAAAITKGDFPPGFVFGTGSSAYQDGAKPSAEYNREDCLRRERRKVGDWG